jgi:hypothetical protein
MTDPRPPSDDPLAAEIAAHRPYTAVKFSGGQGSHQLRCRKCGDEWPCLVRRLADREAAKVLTITRALTHLVTSGLHSNPSSIDKERTAAKRVLQADADETVYDLVANARHLEWVAEMLAEHPDWASETVQSTARVCLDRFRAARRALAPADGGQPA